MPTNPQYVPRELAYQATDSGAETIVALTMNWKMIAKRGATPLKRVILCNIKEYFPPMLKFLFTVAKEKKKDSVRMCADESGVYNFQTLLKQAVISNRSMSSRARSRCWVTLAGRQAFPKARCSTHRNLSRRR